MTRHLSTGGKTRLKVNYKLDGEMMIRPVDDAAIERAIAGYLANPVDADQVPALAAQHHVLPLLLDWTGFIGLASSGKILWLEYDHPHKIEDAEMTEAGRWRAGIRHLAFASGYRRFPALEWLAPVRTLECETCSTCAGTGRPVIGGKPAPNNVQCECGGTGWLPSLAV